MHPYLTPAQIERFWSLVDRSGDCWVWSGPRNRLGYGRFSVGHRSIYLAHRIAWLISTGDLPNCVLHHCYNPPCVRLDHLFAGTRRDNVADMMAKGRYGTRNWIRGADVKTSKLSEQNVLAIRSLWASGNWNQPQLAAAFGVTQ